MKKLLFVLSIGMLSSLYAQGGNIAFPAGGNIALPGSGNVAFPAGPAGGNVPTGTVAQVGYKAGLNTIAQGGTGYTLPANPLGKDYKALPVADNTKFRALPYNDGTMKALPYSNDTVRALPYKTSACKDKVCTDDVCPDGKARKEYNGQCCSCDPRR